MLQLTAGAWNTCQNPAEVDGGCPEALPADTSSPAARNAFLTTPAAAGMPTTSPAAHIRYLTNLKVSWRTSSSAAAATAAAGSPPSSCCSARRLVSRHFQPSVPCRSSPVPAHSRGTHQPFQCHATVLGNPATGLHPPEQPPRVTHVTQQAVCANKPRLASCAVCLHMQQAYASVFSHPA